MVLAGWLKRVSQHQSPMRPAKAAALPAKRLRADNSSVFILEPASKLTLQARNRLSASTSEARAARRLSLSLSLFNADASVRAVFMDYSSTARYQRQLESSLSIRCEIECKANAEKQRLRAQQKKARWRERKLLASAALRLQATELEAREKHDALELIQIELGLLHLRETSAPSSCSSS